MRTLGLVGVLVAATSAAGSALAASCPTPADLYVDGAIDCFVPSQPEHCKNASGNPALTLTDPFGDGAEWTQTGKIDETDTSGTFGSLMVSLTFDDGADFTSDSKTGTWTVTSGWPSTERVAFAFKGGPEYLLYEMDPSGSIFTGDWDLTGLLNRGGQTAALSNFSVYVTAGETPPIPLPAGIWMLLGALGTVCALRRRRAAA